MKKFVIPIVLMLIPILIAGSILKIVGGKQSPILSSSVFVEFVETFPAEDIDKIRYELSEISNIGFSDASKFNPDWSGNLFSDISEIGRMIADFFTAIWEYFSWTIKLMLLITSTIIHMLLWGLSFPSFVINY